MMEQLAISKGFESLFSLAFAGIYFIVKGNYIQNIMEKSSTETPPSPEVVQDIRSKIEDFKENKIGQKREFLDDEEVLEGDRVEEKSDD